MPPTPALKLVLLKVCEPTGTGCCVRHLPTFPIHSSSIGVAHCVSCPHFKFNVKGHHSQNTYCKATDDAVCAALSFYSTSIFPTGLQLTRGMIMFLPSVLFVNTAAVAQLEVSLLEDKPQMQLSPQTSVSFREYVSTASTLGHVSVSKSLLSWKDSVMDSDRLLLLESSSANVGGCCPQVT